MTRKQRNALLIAATAVLIVGGFIVALAAGGSKSSGPQTRSAHVEVVGCKPAHGIQPIAVHVGDTLQLSVTSDCAEEIHIHGYDQHFTVPRNGSATHTLKATLEGGFVIELEHHAEQIAQLEVSR